MLSELDFGPYRPFVEAIAAAQTDDPVPRLVLADQLEEWGHPSAELVRAWCRSWPALQTAWDAGVASARPWHVNLIPRKCGPSRVLAHLFVASAAARTWPGRWDDLVWPTKNADSKNADWYRKRYAEITALSELLHLRVFDPNGGWSVDTAIHRLRRLLTDHPPLVWSEREWATATGTRTRKILISAQPGRAAVQAAKRALFRCKAWRDQPGGLGRLIKQVDEQLRSRTATA